MIAGAYASGLDQPHPWPTSGPVLVSCVFMFKRPAAHFRTGRFASQLRDDAPDHPTTRGQGDYDKLLRSVFDGITGPLIADDSQVIGPDREQAAGKVFAEEDAVMIYVRAL